MDATTRGVRWRAFGREGFVRCPAGDVERARVAAAVVGKSLTWCVSEAVRAAGPRCRVREVVRKTVAEMARRAGDGHVVRVEGGVMRCVPVGGDGGCVVYLRGGDGRASRTWTFDVLGMPDRRPSTRACVAAWELCAKATRRHAGVARFAIRIGARDVAIVVPGRVASLATDTPRGGHDALRAAIVAASMETTDERAALAMAVHDVAARHARDGRRIADVRVDRDAALGEFVIASIGALRPIVPVEHVGRVEEAVRRAIADIARERG